MGFRISRRRPVRISAAVAAVVLAVLGGCGGGSPRLLDESAQDKLHAQVDNLRSVLGNRTQALAAVERFRAEVTRLRDGGDLAAADADVLLTQADQIARQIRADSPAPRPTQVVVVEAPKVEPEEPDKDQGKEKPGKGEGKGDKKGGGS